MVVATFLVAKRYKHGCIFLKLCVSTSNDFEMQKSVQAILLRLVTKFLKSVSKQLQNIGILGKQLVSLVYLFHKVNAPEV